MKLESNVNLKHFNSFAVAATAAQLFHFNSLDDSNKLQSILANQAQRIILGGGSNILLRNDFPGLVIINRLKGIQILDENHDSVLLKVAAGENWHEFVRWSLSKSYFGLENLSLIPGTVGAAPIQNIGAYGVEFEELFETLELIDLASGRMLKFDRDQCQFSYRNSIFKKQLDKYLITSVSLRLNKILRPKLDYAGVKNELLQSGVDVSNPTALQISDAICSLRSSKLPSPARLGNAGSFFKNPVLSEDEYSAKTLVHPSMPAYLLADGRAKIPAAWLIEQCGWKGFRQGDAGVYDKHALVLVNHDNATGEQIWQLACQIQKSVNKKFAIELEPEPRILSGTSN